MGSLSKNINFGAEDKNVGELLFGRERYRIPPYQRPYTWEEDQISDFWNDIYNNALSYFIGSFVFNYENYNNEGYIDVIDGQQRLLTITIFSAVLRDISKELGSDKQAERIQRNCITMEDLRGKQTFRIVCGETTKSFFEGFIQNSGNDITSVDCSSKEEKRIKSNYLSLKEKVYSQLKDISDLDLKLHKIMDFLESLSQIKVIRIKIESEEDAYEIFETVNARGVELSVADLLKNFIFKKIKPQDDKARSSIRNKWLKIEENVLDLDGELTRFLRYYWLSKYEFITVKKLFRNIKSSISDYDRFLNNLLEASELYRKILDANSEDWIAFEGGDKICSSLQGIRMMGVTQCNVLFMSIIRNFEHLGMNPKRIFEIIERFTFAYASVCNFPTNRVEKIYSKYALELETIIQKSDKNMHKNIQTLFARFETDLKKISPTKEEFLANFMEMSYKAGEKNRMIIKYTLSKINNSLTTGEHDINFDNVNIEHILPKRPGKDWGVEKQNTADYVDSLGNLTLLHKRINSAVGNKSLTEKIKYLGSSEIAITKEWVSSVSGQKIPVWGKEQIADRQKKLANRAFEVFSN